MHSKTEESLNISESIHNALSLISRSKQEMSIKVKNFLFGDKTSKQKGEVQYQE